MSAMILHLWSSKLSKREERIVQRKIKSQLCVYITFDYEMAQQSTAPWKLLRQEKVLESFFYIEDEDVLKFCLTQFPYTSIHFLKGFTQAINHRHNVNHY